MMDELCFSGKPGKPSTFSIFRSWPPGTPPVRNQRLAAQARAGQAGRQTGDSCSGDHYLEFARRHDDQIARAGAMRPCARRWNDSLYD